MAQNWQPNSLHLPAPAAGNARPNPDDYAIPAAQQQLERQGQAQAPPAPAAQHGWDGNSTRGNGRRHQPVVLTGLRHSRHAQPNNDGNDCSRCGRRPVEEAAAGPLVVPLPTTRRSRMVVLDYPRLVRAGARTAIPSLVVPPSSSRPPPSEAKLRSDREPEIYELSRWDRVDYMIVEEEEHRPGWAKQQLAEQRALLADTEQARLADAEQRALLADAQQQPPPAAAPAADGPVVVETYLPTIEAYLANPTNSRLKVTCAVCLNELRFPGLTLIETPPEEAEEHVVLRCGHLMGETCFALMQASTFRQVKCPLLPGQRR